MRRIFALSLVLLALVAWTAPAYTAETDPATEDPADLAAEEAPVDELLVEEPLTTPAEEPEALDFLDPQNEWEQKIRECTEQETWQHCGSSACDCIFAGQTFYCFC